MLPATGEGKPAKMSPRPFDINYAEGLKVGYKWYDTEGKEPLFPFGFGLSYTTYSYSGLEVTAGKEVKVSFHVTNTGPRAGEEVAQVYASLPPSAGEPPRRLVGWERIPLAPGETKAVTLEINPQFLSIFNVDGGRWELVPGDYAIHVGGSARSTPLTETVRITRGR
jgi:beta-glucosidase